MADIRQMSMYPDDELAARIEKLAKAQDRSTSATLIWIVRKFLDRADMLFVMDARERGVISHDEAMARLAVLIERDGNGTAA